MQNERISFEITLYLQIKKITKQCTKKAGKKEVTEKYEKNVVKFLEQ